MAFLFLSIKRTMSRSPSSDLPPVLSILYQALLLPFKSISFSLPLLLFSVLSSSLLFSSSFTSLSPSLTDLFTKLCHLFKDPHAPDFSIAFSDITVDLRRTARLVSLLAPATSLSSLLFLLAAVCIFSSAYTNSSLTPQSLVKRIVSRWYQTVVTGLYVLLLTLGYFSLSFIILSTIALNTDADKTSAQTPLGSTMSLTGVSVLLYFYLYTRWSMAMVISVVEETWGIGALSMSVVLFIGNKKVGTALTFIIMAVRVVIYGFLGFIFMSKPPVPPDQQMKVGTAIVSAGALWELYGVAVYTVFYHYCRKSHGLEAAAAAGDVVEEGFVYASLPIKVDSEQ